VRLEGLGQLKKTNDLTGNRNSQQFFSILLAQKCPAVTFSSLNAGAASKMRCVANGTEDCRFV
jgi:hypothetical protein